MNIFQKINQRLIWKINDLRYALHIGKPLIPNHASQGILLYHGIDTIGSTAYNTRFISESMLEKQLQYFTQYAKVLSLDEYYQNDFPQDKMSLALTFDDGYQNNLTRALPLLEKYQTPATFFITAIRHLNQSILWTDLIDLATPLLPKAISILNTTFQKNRKGQFTSTLNNENVKHFLQKKTQKEIENALIELKEKYPFTLDNYHQDYYQTLTNTEIQTLAQHPLITIGVHGLYHIDWTILSEEDCIKELTLCKDYLENLIQKPINGIAFPFGHYNQTVLSACEKTGFTQFLALDAHSKHPLMKDRFGVNPFISFENQILAIINGKY